MNPDTRQLGREPVLLAIVILALLAACFYSYARLGSARSHFTVQADARMRCEALAGQIQALRDQPTMADDHAMLKADMTQHIANAASAASIEGNKLVAIDHQNARRIGRTAYLEKPTRLTLRDVDMQQVLTILYTLTADNARLNVTRLRLTAPRDESDSASWAADATLAYLIYDPVENNGS